MPPVAEALEEEAAMLDGTATTDELIAVTELGLIEDAVGLVELACGVVELLPPPPPHPISESNKPDNSSLFVRVIAILFIVVNNLQLPDAAAREILT